MGVLKADPRHRRCPAPRSRSPGTSLPAEQDVSIVWATANVDWVLDAEPDSVDYLGRKATKIAVVLATATTDASGAFSVRAQGAAGLRRHPRHLRRRRRRRRSRRAASSIARTGVDQPERGPDRDDDHGHVTGLGSRLYEGGAALLYDNHYIGAVMANWTRGDGDRPDPRHRPGRQAHDRDRRRDQLQVPEHPAVADPVGRRLQVRRSRSRRTTGGRRRASTGPRTVTPTLDARTTLATASLARRQPRRRRRSSSTSGPGRLEGRRHRDGADAERAGRASSGRRSSATASTAPGRAGRSSRSRSAPRRRRPTAR